MSCSHEQLHLPFEQAYVYVACPLCKHAMPLWRLPRAHWLAVH